MTGMPADRTRRRFLGFIIAVTVVQAMFALLLASGKPLWFDEIDTLAVARLHSWSAIWRADLDDVDATPPLYHYLEGRFLRLPLRPEIALRIPSVLAFSLAIPALFLFVNRRLGPWSGSIAACIPLVTGAYAYSYEARNYALTLGLIAAALVVWQKAHDKPRSFAYPGMLAVLLVTASATSYNALYALVPFFVAEIVFTLRNRRIHWRVLVALLFALIPYPLYWPILSRFREYYGPGFWSKPSIGVMLESVSWWADQSTAAFLFLLMTIGVLIALWFGKAGSGEPTPANRAPLEEWVLTLFFCAIPAELFLLASVMKGGMAPRYTICLIIGGSLLLAYATRSFNRAALSAVFLCAISAFVLLGTWHLRYQTDASQTVSKRLFLRQFLDGRTPVVIANGLTFVQLGYYSPPEIRRELYYLANPVLGRHYLHTDSVDLRAPVLGCYLALQVDNDQDFFAGHHDFLLYTDGQWNWLGPYLLDSGASMQLIGQNGEAALYKVALPDSMHR